MRVPVTLLLLAASVTATAAPRPDPTPPPDTVSARPTGVRPQEVGVTLRGCLDGRRLHLSPGAVNDVQVGVLRATEFMLEGPRDLMQMLARDHDRHEEEIIGTAVIPPSPANATVTTKTVKRGRVTAAAGVRDSGGGMAGHSAIVGDTNLPIRVRVQSVTHIAERCTPSR